MRDLKLGERPFKYSIDAQAGRHRQGYCVHGLQDTVHRTNMETNCHDRRRWIRRAQPRFSLPCSNYPPRASTMDKAGSSPGSMRFANHRGAQRTVRISTYLGIDIVRL